MRVAIIGSNGQLGTDICRLLGENAIKLTIDDLNICDIDKTKRILGDLEPEAIINTAALHDLNKCEEDKRTALDVNVLGLVGLVSSSNYLNIPIVHISTNYVFNGEKDSPYIESDKVSPINYYGTTKALGEVYVSLMANKHFIVRTAGLYGKSGCMGKDGSNFVDKMIKIGKTGVPIRMNSEETISPTSTESLARELICLLESKKYGLYHTTCRGECSWYEFTKEIFSIKGIECELIESNISNSLIKRPKNGVLDCLKFGGLNILPHWKRDLKDYLK